VISRAFFSFSPCNHYWGVGGVGLPPNFLYFTFIIEYFGGKPTPPTPLFYFTFLLSKIIIIINNNNNNNNNIKIII